MFYPDIYNFHSRIAQLCSGKAAGIRFVDSRNARQYIECDGNGGQVTKQCPNAKLTVIGADFVDRIFDNGEWFSPVFLTCVHTTTGAAPG